MMPAMKSTRDLAESRPNSAMGEVDEDESVDFSATCNSTGNVDESHSSEDLGKKETLSVFRLRSLVILVLILTAAAISYTVFRLSHEAETEEFATQYEGAAEKVISCKLLVQKALWHVCTQIRISYPSSFASFVPQHLSA